MRSCANSPRPGCPRSRRSTALVDDHSKGHFCPQSSPFQLLGVFCCNQLMARPESGITMTNYWKICAAILAGTVGLSAQAAGPVTTLKVMSFNIQVNGSGSGG